MNVLYNNPTRQDKFVSSYEIVMLVEKEWVGTQKTENLYDRLEKEAEQVGIQAGFEDLVKKTYDSQIRKIRVLMAEHQPLNLHTISSATSLKAADEMVNIMAQAYHNQHKSCAFVVAIAERTSDYLFVVDYSEKETPPNNTSVIHEMMLKQLSAQPSCKLTFIEQRKHLTLDKPVNVYSLCFPGVGEEAKKIVMNIKAALVEAGQNVRIREPHINVSSYRVVSSAQHLREQELRSVACNSGSSGKPKV